MEITLPTYEEYFRQIAVNNNHINHQVAAEAPEGDSANRHFVSFDVDDIVRNISTAFGSGPCLCMQMYSWNTEDNGMEYIRYKYRGAIMVIQRTDGSAEQVSAARIETEKILRSIQAQMRIDISKLPGSYPSPLNMVNWNSIEVLPVNNIWTQCYGWFFQFPFEMVEETMSDADIVAEYFNQPGDYVDLGGGGVDLGGGVILTTG